MLYPEFRYVDTALYGLNNRNTIKDIRKLKIPSDGVDHHKSLFRFPDEYVEHFKTNNSVKGYKGACYADFFVVDIDNKQEPEKALEELRFILNMLEFSHNIDLRNVRIFFSGYKGYHILIPSQMFGISPSLILDKVFKEIARNLFDGRNVDFQIYDKNRLIRLSNTINSKSNRYKIPLSIDEIYHLDFNQMKDIAVDPRPNFNYLPLDEVVENDSLMNIYKNAVETVEKKAVTKQYDKLIIEEAPKYNKICYHNILKDGLGEGFRDAGALRLGIYYKKLGYNSEIVKNLLMGWSNSCRPPLEEVDIDRIIKQTYENDYDFGCNDEILKNFCSNKCHFFKDKNIKEITAYTVDDLETKYLEYVQNINKNKILLGIPKLDEALRGISQGEVMQIIARSSVGKTAFLINLLRNVCLSNIDCVFYSLEMPAAQIFERMNQISNLKKGAFVENIYIKQEPEIQKLKNNVKRDFSNLVVIDKDFMSIEDIYKNIISIETKYNKNFNLIAIDYLGRMKGPKGSEYEVISDLAKNLKYLAKELDKAVICLHQTNRTGGTGKEEITMDQARGSGVVEEAADHVLALWRPDINDAMAQVSDKEEVIIAILKNRKGRKGKHTMTLHKPYLRFEEMNQTLKINNETSEEVQQDFFEGIEK